MKRACGILMPVFSLPGNYGIGSFSIKAFEFVDTLKKAAQSYWQILPLGPTGYGDSPYQSFSSFAGNPYFIDLDDLAAEGLLDVKELSRLNWGGNNRFVDYGKQWDNREKMLKKAYESFLAGKGKTLTADVLAAELKELNPETKEYCLYRAIKNEQGGKSWQAWDQDLKLRKPEALEKFKKSHEAEIAFQEWIQAVFSLQWKRLKNYANRKGISIIGDIPIYVSADSADAWAHPELFCFDKDRRPLKVAGCPPDYFSPDGQLWGNPLYLWDVHKKTGWKWWISRLEYAFSVYNYVRIDHFRGLDEYYAIDAAAENAKKGKWEPGPGMELIRGLKEAFADRYKELPIIAEDLGLLTDTVIKLLKDSGFPGMKVLEFSYDSDNENAYLPHNFERNCVVYTGTHDNAPLMDWIKGLSEKTRLHMIRYQGSEHTPENDLYWDCIRTVLGSVADTAIVPMWDYLGAGPEGRVNVPSSAGGNWRWRMLQGEFNKDLIWHCDMLAEIYRRKPEEPKKPAPESNEAGEKAEAEEKAEAAVSKETL